MQYYDARALAELYLACRKPEAEKYIAQSLECEFALPLLHSCSPVIFFMLEKKDYNFNWLPRIDTSHTPPPQNLLIGKN